MVSNGTDPWPARIVAGGFIALALVVASGLVVLPAKGATIPESLSGLATALATILGTFIGYLFGRSSGGYVPPADNK